MRAVGIFLFSCTLFVLHLYLFFCPDFLAFCLLSVRKTHNTNIHAPNGIRTRNPNNRVASDQRLRPRGRRDRRMKPQARI